MGLRYSDAGARKKMAKLDKIAERVAHPEPMWPRVGRVISKHVALQFATEGAHFGTPWKPLTPQYAAWKKANGGAGGILVFSGEMRDSLTKFPMDVTEIRGDSATFGTRNQKAIWHQFGTTEDGQQINPPRPMLIVTPELRDDVKDEMRKYIMGRLKL